MRVPEQKELVYIDRLEYSRYPFIEKESKLSDPALVVDEVMGLSVGSVVGGLLGSTTLLSLFKSANRQIQSVKCEGTTPRSV